MNNRQQTAERLQKCADLFTTEFYPYISEMAMRPTYWDGALVPFDWALWWAKKGQWPDMSKTNGAAGTDEAMYKLGKPQKAEVQEWLALSENEYSNFLSPLNENNEIVHTEAEAIAFGNPCQSRDFAATLGPEIFDIRGKLPDELQGQNTYYGWLCSAVAKGFKPEEDNTAMIQDAWRILLMRGLADNWIAERSENQTLPAAWLHAMRNARLLAKEVERLGGDPEAVLAKGRPK